MSASEKIRINSESLNEIKIQSLFSLPKRIEAIQYRLPGLNNPYSNSCIISLYYTSGYTRVSFDIVVPGRCFSDSSNAVQ